MPPGHWLLKVLLLNQTFYPDVMATSQYLSEVAVRLAERGHAVTVVTGRRGYDDRGSAFAKREVWRGVQIHRVASTGFGKDARWKRAADFASFLVACGSRLAALPRHDVVVALTSPPLISCLGAWIEKAWRGRFVYWVMDLNPDEALAAGWLRPGSFAARMLERLSRFSLHSAAKIIALDRFAAERLQAKGVPPAKIAVIPPWSLDGEVQFDPAGRDRFRKAHGLEGKFVVMYSGNHSPCHPLDTLLEAALRLREDPSVRFCFVGGGSGFLGVQRFAAQHRLGNILCLRYQPLAQLAGSLSTADVHAVVMGDAFVGIVHPCKIYNILNVLAPVLYIGPRPSHVTEILEGLGSGYPWAWARHGQVDAVVQQLQRLREQAHPSMNRCTPSPHPSPPRGGGEGAQRAGEGDSTALIAPTRGSDDVESVGQIRCGFARERLLPQIIAEVEGISPTPS